MVAIIIVITGVIIACIYNLPKISYNSQPEPGTQPSETILTDTNPSTLTEEQRSKEIELLKADYQKNKTLYTQLITAIEEGVSENEEISAYYDMEQQCLMTYIYGNEPEQLKSPKINSAYKQYAEQSNISFTSIDVYFDDGMYIYLSSRWDKENIYGDLYNPLFLLYSSENIPDDNWSHYEYIQIADNWYANFSSIL